MSVNNCVFSGHVGKDPEMSYTTSGLAVTKTSLAVRDWDSRNGETTMWLDIVCFDKLAERLARYVTKGQFVEIVGKLKQWKYDNKQGVEVTTYSIVCTQLEFTPKEKQTPKVSPVEPQEVQEPPYYSNNPVGTVSVTEETNQSKY